MITPYLLALIRSNVVAFRRQSGIALMPFNTTQLLALLDALEEKDARTMGRQDP